MPLRECMERTTHREYQAWIAWLDMQWERPNRSDFYLMQVAAEVRRVLHKRPSSVQLKHFLLKFKGGKKDKPSPEHVKKMTEWTKARWTGFVKSVKGKSNNG